MRDTRTGRFALLRQLLADGIICIFGNPGSSEENLLDALREQEFSSIKYYLALHEGTAVAMADGYARAMQRPAFVQLHSYAGLANGLGMIYYARRGYTPMVVIAGEAGLRYDALDGQMSADLVGMARPFVKSDHNGPCAWRVTDPGSLLRLVRRAIKAAATPPRGPVFLALPMDVLDLPNTEPVVRSPRVETNITPDQETITQAAGRLGGAQMPLILAGDGVAASGAQSELTDVAELLGATVWGANYSDVNMPASHPLFGGYLGHMFGEDSRTVTSAADAVLICGTTVLPEVFPALQGVFAENAFVVHFDLNGYEIGKNFPITIGALGEPKATLAMLANELRRTMSREQNARARDRLNARRSSSEADRRRKLESDVGVFDQVPIRAAQFMIELAKRLPPDAIVFDEALTNSPELCRYLPQDRPGSYFQTRAGMLGTGLPGTLGVKVAHPDKMVIGFSGDGGGISTIQSLSTAARHRLGAKFIICNNKSYRILKYNLQHYWRERGEPLNQPFPKEFDLASPNLRFDLLAEGQGVAATRVERPEQIGPALDRALENDEPFLIDLVLNGDL